MSMGYGSNYADVLDEKVIKDSCPKEWKEFMSALKNQGFDLDEFAECINLGELEEENKNLQELFVNLREALEARTGMEISLLYHNSDDNGDRYDDVNGAFFHVDNFYIKNPVLERFHDKVERKFFVTFG